nr:hypothetical protein [Tanacetum cinerariifolium]
MTGNISYLTDYEPYDGGYVSFGQGGCKITGKGTIKIDESMLWHRRLGHLNFKNMNSSGIFSLQQGELSSLAVGTSSGSRNSSLTVGMPCTFYSQHLFSKGIRLYKFNLDCNTTKIGHSGIRV